MSEWHGTGETDGRITLNPIAKASLKKYLAENGPCRIRITHELPESNKLRGWFEGAIIPLVTFYQEGMDHHSKDDRLKVREWLKAEFNGELVTIAGKVQRVAKSSKGRAVFNPYVERVMDWFVPNYEPPQEAIDPEYFKVWRDTIRSFGGPGDYIDYLVQTGKLSTNTSRRL